MPNPERPIAFLTGIIIVTFAGAAGGLVAAIAAVIEGGKGKSGEFIALKGVSVWLFVLGRTLVGIGGGTAALFVALSIGRYATPPTSIDLLSLTALCFIAGSIGHRILPLVAAQLERQISETRRQADEAGAAAQRAESKVEQVSSTVEMAREVAQARTIMADPTAQDGAASARDASTPALFERTRARLEEFRRDFPTDRGLNFVLARLYMKKLHDLPKAVGVLESFITTLTQQGRRDADVADAWFNIACYYSLALGDVRDEPTRKELTDKAMTAFGHSVDILPQNLADAEADSDLANLRKIQVWRDRFGSPAAVKQG